MGKKQKAPGPKPVTVSLYPMAPEKALAAFMQIDFQKVKRREERKATRKRGKHG